MENPNPTLKTMNKLLLPLLGALTLTVASCSETPAPSGSLHRIDIQSRTDLHAWFHYSPTRPIVISGHRGGMISGYPENCIESFEKTLTIMPSFFEIDPRLTRDSVIVLMHDATIDRTTDGSGLVSDYTWEELQRFRLKDRDGKLTEFRIPTLEEAIRWSQGKTILNLDIKDVPLEFMSQFINRLDPPNVMYTVHNARQARMLLDRDPEAMFSAWCKNLTEYRAYREARIPASQMMAYVGTMIYADQQPLYDSLHRQGILCMISVAPTHDRRATETQKQEGYLLEIASGCDVIETDYPYLFEGLDLERR